MATPVGDSYGCASGGAIAAGRFRLPSGFPSAPLTWAEVGSNTLSALDPANDPATNPNYPGSAPWRGITGQVSIISAWCGALWDESRRRLWIWGGGHGDYAGNEMYAWDAIDATFRRLSNPTGAIGNTGDLVSGSDSGVYFDGRPRSCHTYNNFAMRGVVPWFFGGSTYQTGFGPNVAFSWSGGDFVRESTGTVPVGFGGVAYDSLRDVFRLFQGGTHQPREFDPKTKTVSIPGGWADLTGTYASPHYNQARDVFVVLENDIHVMSYTGDSQKPPVLGEGPSFSWQHAGMAYDADNDRYLVWHGGASVYVLTPPPVGNNPKTSPWSWAKIDPAAGNTVTPTSAESNGTYGRFWYSPSLKCCGVVNATNQKMYVFRLA